MKRISDFLKEGFGSAYTDEALENIINAGKRLQKIMSVAMNNSELQRRINPRYEPTNSKGHNAVKQARQEIDNIKYNIQKRSNEWNGAFD